MGQSSSSTQGSSFRHTPANFVRSTSNFDPFSLMNHDFTESNDADDGDLISELPDECLSLIFQCLSSGDRKKCSLVCLRWLRVEGQSRHRIALNAQAELITVVPELFSRFDSVTKLALRCDRRSKSVNDEALTLIALRCPNLTRLKLRGCREVTCVGMTAFAMHTTCLKKFSCGSCMFGAKGINALLNYCSSLEEISIKRLRGISGDATEPICPGVAASSLKSICLKELYNGQCFGPLIIESKHLKSLKLLRCLGDWDSILEMVATKNNSLVEVYLERLQVSDIGLSALSNCPELEILHIVKTPDCTNVGVVSVAENCKLMRKLHIDGWRTNRIGDEGLIAIAKHSARLQELVLIGVNPSTACLEAVASGCQKLERLALCGSQTIADAEISCIAAKCAALKKLCIKGCPVSDQGIGAFAWGCPNLVKIKVKKCRDVTSEVGDLLRMRRGSLMVNLDVCEVEVEAMDASASDSGVQDEVGELQPVASQEITGTGNADALSSNDTRPTSSKSKFSLFGGRSFVACALRRWSNRNSSSNGSS